MSLNLVHTKRRVGSTNLLKEEIREKVTLLMNDIYVCVRHKSELADQTTLFFHSPLPVAVLILPLIWDLVGADDPISVVFVHQTCRVFIELRILCTDKPTTIVLVGSSALFLLKTCFIAVLFPLLSVSPALKPPTVPETTHLR